MNKMILQLENISFSYEKSINNIMILDKCSAGVEPQSVTAILGRNGQGKTTLIRCILKLVKCRSGRILLQGKEISKYSVEEYARKISYVPQLNAVVNDSAARDYIVEGRTPYLKFSSLPKKEDYEKSEFYAEKMGVKDCLGKYLSQLSGGQLQMVMIARALVQETPIILMDEPLSALDMKNQYEVMKLIKSLTQEGKTILFTTHNPNHALALKCMVWLLNNSTIFRSGKVDEIITEELLQEIYGTNISLRSDNGWKCCGFSDVI